MKKTILSIAAAVAISMGALGAANTASADVATPVVAVKKADTVNPNAGVKIRIRHGYHYGYKPYYGYRHLGSYRHCKFLLHKWKVYGSWHAKRKFYRFGCARWFY